MPSAAQHQRFQELMEQHQGLLFKVAHTYCPNESDRQDLLQEIRIQVWQSLPRYREQYSLSTWLYRISLNVAISFYRKNTARQGQHLDLNEQLVQVPAPEKSEREQQLQLLERFIAELRELDKALMLLYLEDRSHADIADILGMSASNVGTRIGRIKEKLKQRFTQQQHS
ncbi:MAG: sigma-70 family RNA polymerase sigma factor [Saprospiraceae bacterium]|nr:sigma-70 family RNA polymerase sigma factor [Saprospiraceae bacterium]